KRVGEGAQKGPRAVPLRLHLATLLLDSGAESAALEHFVTILGQEPANIDALQGAARAADMLGDSSRAQGYRQLLQALHPAPGGQPAPPEGERAPAEPHGGDATPWWEIEWPNLMLKDVGGMEAVKRRLNVAFLGPMRNPELRKAYGKSLR